MGTAMRLDRARTTALLAAIVLSAGGWVISAPTAQADPVGFCVKASKTYEKFKKCYEDCEQSSVDQSGNNPGSQQVSPQTGNGNNQAGGSGNNGNSPGNEAAGQGTDTGNQGGNEGTQKCR